MMDRKQIVSVVLLALKVFVIMALMSVERTPFIYQNF